VSFGKVVLQRDSPIEVTNRLIEFSITNGEKRPSVEALGDAIIGADGASKAARASAKRPASCSNLPLKR